jgi:hypothetical protein
MANWGDTKHDLEDLARQAQDLSDQEGCLLDWLTDVLDSIFELFDLFGGSHDHSD